jgi:4-hydroxythreonine-4-phosphate dehydrogenase
MLEKIKIGISQGDINSISYEIIIKSLMDKRIMEICTPIIYGSPKVAAYHRNVLEIESFSLNNISSAEHSHPKRVNIIDCFKEELKVELGKSTPIAGEASYQALNRATEDLKEGLIDALVTGPINKDNIQSEQFSFPGHTEFLKSRLNSDEVLMLLVSQNIRIGVVVGHIPISEVASMITKEAVLKKIKIMNKTLLEDFGIRKPKIAVLGLNPHAGDNGVIGNEELEQIIPAIDEAREKGIMALGPYPADGFFGSGEFSKFDAILAMYHDQGLAPFKALAFDSGVNYTAGLPVIRTSPAHGTAYGIAGENKASIESFKNALYLAIDAFRKRKEYQNLNQNPL